MNRPLRVLLIEDHPLACSLLSRTINRTDPTIEVVGVGTLADGLDSLATHFDIVLLDLMLPDTGGLSGLKSIQDANPELPVVVLTGAGDDYRWAALEMGAQDYLLKGPEVNGPNVVRCLRHAVIRNEVRMKYRHAALARNNTEVQLEKADRLDTEYQRQRSQGV